MSKKLFFRVGVDSLMPANSISLGEFRAKQMPVGEIVSISISKLRNNGFNRFSHAVGGLIAANVESFEGYDAHCALKRLQLEANAGCYEIKAFLRGKWELCRIPKSLSFDSMGEDEYKNVMKKIFAFVAENYWTTETPEEIERMAYEHMRNQ